MKSCIVQIRLEPADCVRLDALATALGMTRSAAVRHELRLRLDVVQCTTNRAQPPVGGEGGGVSCSKDLQITSKVVRAPNLKSKEKIPHVVQCTTTWLSPYLDAWVARFGGRASPGILAKYLAPLVEQYGPEKTLTHFTNFLAGSDARFVNVARFAQTFGMWTSTLPEAWRHDPKALRPGESDDQYFHRLGNM